MSSMYRLSMLLYILQQIGEPHNNNKKNSELATNLINRKVETPNISLRIKSKSLLRLEDSKGPWPTSQISSSIHQLS